MKSFGMDVEIIKMKSKERSVTFGGVASAMADQWGSLGGKLVEQQMVL